jgi:mannitol-specific phosphotransferase system IIBC component
LKNNLKRDVRVLKKIISLIYIILTFVISVYALGADGKKFKEVLEKLYKPEEIEVAGASVRGTKIRAAMQNAVNSGVYKPE